MPAHHLSIARADLRDMLPALARLGGSASRDEAVIGFDDDELWIRAGGMECSAKASGDWPGEAVIAHATLKALSRATPDDDPVVFTVTDGRLMVGKMAVPCTWHAQGAAVISLPMNADLRELLLADMMHAEDALEASGILRQIRDARTRRDELLDRAATLLAPLGISRADIARIAHEALLHRL
jgi:hypothetical protein